jgi:gliding motility-associatede transport system auxiliary component
MNINQKEIGKFAGIIGAALLIGGYVRYNIQELWSWFNLSLVIAGAALLLVSLVLNFRAIIQFFGGRTGRLGANTALLSIAVLTILVVLNFLGFRHHKRFDLTEEKLYTISDQTKKILSGLPKDVKVIKFDKTEDQKLSDTMSEFKYVSKRISYERIDPQEKPEVANQYKIQRMGETLVIAGDRTERPSNTGEQDLINAVMKVTRDKMKTICFVEGHGEKNHAADGDYSIVDKGLKTENYETKSVNLVTSNQVPSECSVLIEAGPKKALFPQEAAMIGKYLDEGGKALVMVDPDTDPGLGDVFKSWNIEVGNNTVIDASGVGRLFGTGPAVPLVASYGNHPITKDMTRTGTFFPLARSVKTSNSAGGDAAGTDILKTSEASWAETELKGNQAKFDPGKDTQGPISLGVAAVKRKTEKEGRFVVIGDSDFASNENISRAGNGDLILNTVNWLAQDEDLISIRPKSATNRSVNMTASQQALFKWLVMAFMPLAVIGSGVWVWFKRR